MIVRGDLSQRKIIVDLGNTTFSPNSCFSAYLLAQRRPLKLELCVNDLEVNQSIEEWGFFSL